MATKVRYDTIDFIKVVACILVVFIHCPFPGAVGGGITAIARIAVPFFLMVSGYFCVNSSGTLSTESLNRKVLHILKLCLFSYVFYALVRSARCIDGNPFDFSSFVSSFVGYFGKGGMFLITNAPPYSLHLWFLGALLYSYLSFYPSFIRKFFLKRKSLILCIAVTLSVFLISSEILPIFNQSITFRGYTLQTIFLFRALPFFLIGLYIRLYPPLKNLKDWHILALTFVFLLVSLIEWHFQVVNSQAYLGSVLCSALLLIHGVRSNIHIPRIFVFMGAELSLYVYIFHISLIPVARALALSEWLTPIIVVILSFVMAGVAYSIKLLSTALLKSKNR